MGASSTPASSFLSFYRILLSLNPHVSKQRLPGRSRAGTAAQGPGQARGAEAPRRSFRREARGARPGSAPRRASAIPGQRYRILWDDKGPDHQNPPPSIFPNPPTCRTLASPLVVDALPVRVRRRSARSSTGAARASAAPTALHPAGRLPCIVFAAKLRKLSPPAYHLQLRAASVSPPAAGCVRRCSASVATGRAKTGALVRRPGLWKPGHRQARSRRTR